MHSARFCLAESGLGFFDFRWAFAFWCRSYCRFERASRFGSGDVGRSSRGRSLTRSLKMVLAVSDVWALLSRSKATWSWFWSFAAGCEAILWFASHVYRFVLDKGLTCALCGTVRYLAESWANFVLTTSWTLATATLRHHLSR